MSLSIIRSDGPRLKKKKQKKKEKKDKQEKQKHPPRLVTLVLICLYYASSKSKGHIDARAESYTFRFQLLIIFFCRSWKVGNISRLVSISGG